MTDKQPEWWEVPSYVGRRAEVMFDWVDRTIFRGIVIRNDKDEPFMTIIRLDDGREVTQSDVVAWRVI